MYKSRKRSASPSSRQSRYGRGDDDAEQYRRSDTRRRARTESHYSRPDDRRGKRADRREEDSGDKKQQPAGPPLPAGTIQVTFDDRSGKKITLPCLASDSISSVKKKIEAAIGTKANKFVLKRGPRTFKDQGSLDLYEVHDKTSVEIMYT